MARALSLESRVLDRVRPSPEEEHALRDRVDRLLRILRERARARGLDVEPILVGSAAKGTHLKNPDVDLFVLFPAETPREVLEKEGLALGAFLKNRERMFAEHPYTHGYFEDLEVEVVPCYRISDATQKMSAVDRTPFHARFVIERITAAQRDEVRLLKAFCKGTGTYGAEARVQGFSGYLCELLVLRFGSFTGVLEAAAGWRAGTRLGLETAATREFPEPLAFVDPIDGGRNVASAVSAATLAVFVHATQAYRARPSERFFFPRSRKPLTAAAAARVLRKRGTELLALALPAPALTEDVLYPQVHKAARAVADELGRHGFTALGARAERLGREVVLLLELEVARLPAAEKHFGPPAWVKNAEDFLAKWRGSRAALSRPFLDGDRWAVLVRREFPDAASLLRGRAHTLSLGKNLDAATRRARVLEGRAALKAAWLGEVTELLDPRFLWER